jgi:hypothetical protein
MQKTSGVGVYRIRKRHQCLKEKEVTKKMRGILGIPLFPQKTVRIYLVLSQSYEFRRSVPMVARQLVRKDCPGKCGDMSRNSFICSVWTSTFQRQYLKQSWPHILSLGIERFKKSNVLVELVSLILSFRNAYKTRNCGVQMKRANRYSSEQELKTCWRLEDDASFLRNTSTQLLRFGR